MEEYSFNCTRQWESGFDFIGISSSREGEDLVGFVVGNNCEMLL